MNVVWCPRCKQEQRYAKIWAFAPKRKGGILRFRVGTYVRCSICGLIFVAVLEEDKKQHAIIDQGETILDGGRTDSSGEEG